MQIYHQIAFRSLIYFSESVCSDGSMSQFKKDSLNHLGFFVAKQNDFKLFLMETC